MANEQPKFETDAVKVDRALEQGLGLGAREIAAQKDPGSALTADEDPEADIEVDGAGRSHRPD